MRRLYKYLLPLSITMTMLLSGCSLAQSSQTTSTETSVTVAESEASVETVSATSTDTTASAIAATSTVVVDTEFTASDLEVGYDVNTASTINLEDSTTETAGSGVTEADGIITISEEGTYIVTGTLTEGQIVVDAEDTAKVQIVLSGVTIHCSNSAAIYIKNADKVFITLADGAVNTLTDGSEYVQTDDNTVDGVIFSEADLTFNGNGTLNITGNYKHGIAAKDELNFTGGTYNITAEKDAINGNDGVKIKAGTFTLSASTGNGIQSKNSEDTTKGYVYIAGGEITITNCVEGIEGTAIVVEGGTIDLTSQDDGFNASVGTESASDTFLQGGTESSSGEENCYIDISGGTINIDASGDGLDSNGSLAISGGNIYVNGPDQSGNASLDYNGTAEITGGTIVAVGTAQMAQGFSDSSTQYSILYSFSSTCEAGSEVTLTDSEGNVIASFTPNKQYQAVVISSPKMQNGATYTLTSGTQTADITLSSVVTSNVTATSDFGGGGHGGSGSRSVDQTN